MTDENLQKNDASRDNRILLIGMIIGVILSGGWWFIIYACRLKLICPF